MKGKIVKRKHRALLYFIRCILGEGERAQNVIAAFFPGGFFGVQCIPCCSPALLGLCVIYFTLKADLRPKPQGNGVLMTSVILSSSPLCSLKCTVMCLVQSFSCN